MVYKTEVLDPKSVKPGDVYLFTFKGSFIPGIVTEVDELGFEYDCLTGGGVQPFNIAQQGIILRLSRSGDVEFHVGSDVHRAFVSLLEKIQE